MQTTITNGVRAYVREIAHFARRTAAAPEHELSEHLNLLSRQLDAVRAIRSAMTTDGAPPPAANTQAETAQ
jgi:hypothetical protein